MPAIDISHRIIQPSANDGGGRVSKVRWHTWRRLLQVICGIAFVALPLTNGLRLDIHQGLFYFAWRKIAVQDMTLVFWVGFLGLWCLVAVSFLYGRLWCGWVCPQTIASDFADSLKKRLDKAFRTRPGKPLFLVSRSIWTAAILAASVGTGIALGMYWLDPKLIWESTLNPAVDVGASTTVYGIAAFMAADMLWIRRKFCSGACPYGPLLGTLVDKNTLAVRYLDERNDECIKCHKCEVDCPMEIDIKHGVSQHSCIGCGECIDSCNDVLGKRGIPGLIEYRFGTDPERTMAAITPLQRLGVWDPIRWGVLATLVVLIGVVGVLCFGRWPVSATINANGTVARANGVVSNGYEITVSNNSPDYATYESSVTGLPGATLQMQDVDIDARGMKTVKATVTAPVSSAPPPGRRVRIDITVGTMNDHTVVKSFFYSPKIGE